MVSTSGKYDPWRCISSVVTSGPSSGAGVNSQVNALLKRLVCLKPKKLLPLGATVLDAVFVVFEKALDCTEKPTVMAVGGAEDAAGFVALSVGDELTLRRTEALRLKCLYSCSALTTLFASAADSRDAVLDDRGLGREELTVPRAETDRFWVAFPPPFGVLLTAKGELQGWLKPTIVYIHS